jgi:hypothetical protein
VESALLVWEPVLGVVSKERVAVPTVSVCAVSEELPTVSAYLVKAKEPAQV